MRRIAMRAALHRRPIVLFLTVLAVSLLVVGSVNAGAAVPTMARAQAGHALPGVPPAPTDPQAIVENLSAIQSCPFLVFYWSAPPAQYQVTDYVVTLYNYGDNYGATPTTTTIDTGSKATNYSPPVSYTHLRAHETVLDLV